MKLNRRAFNGGVVAGVAAAATGYPSVLQAARRPYSGPNVIIVRFGGGVRRLETIAPKHTYAPFLRHTLVPRGVFIPDVRIEQIEGMDTSHAEGTINVLTGRYAAWQDAGSVFLQQRLAPNAPTLFEYFRKTFAVPAHHALLVNGEDRLQEEFFSFGTHRHFGVSYRSEVLSLYRFKLWNLARIVREGKGSDELLAKAQKQLEELRKKDPVGRGGKPSTEIEKFWVKWQSDYRDSGLVNPRGDRLLTTLALRAMEQLRPRLMMVNYQDSDYVHWGNASHYTRAIGIIDDGLRQLVQAAESLETDRGRTVFVVTPDCGRDSNPMMDIPFQHHFNTDSAREIWALIFGPGIQKGRVLKRPVDQTTIAPTIAGIMGFRASNAESNAIPEVFA